MRLILLGIFFGLSLFTFAESGERYIQKFEAYSEWSNNLSSDPSPEFLNFINNDSPLANKLRNKWLTHLAKDKNWTTYTQYYKASQDTALQCYALTARYHSGDKEAALKAAEPIWRIGHSQPSACDELFKLLLAQPKKKNALLTQRIRSTLQTRNLSLARYLLKKLEPPRHNDVALLNKIYSNPSQIVTLSIDELHDDYYLYGLKRMVTTDMDKAILYWHHVKTKKLLSEAQQQEFLVHVSLYKAMRNHEDTFLWFAKVKPQYYNDVLIDWQIRFALKKHAWKKVEKLIQLTHDAENPCWKYWQARALEAQGKRKQAKPIYETLSKTRHYYGFLASIRLHKPFNFEEAKSDSNLENIAFYHPFTNKIKTLYHSNHVLDASRLLNDFVLELPKNERSTLAYWLAHELKWHAKALYLSNNDELNNQLTLRFPLAYNKTIAQVANRYNLKKEFIFAVIRQESTFRKKVVSSAGAHGLMQVMPETAKNVVRREKIPYKNQHDLFSPSQNIRIGTAYLKYLATRFNNHPVLMAAAYNAGPEQVVNWLENHPPKQIDIWVETLPWHETRNYLKNIIAFTAVYQHRLQKKPDLSEFMKAL